MELLKDTPFEAAWVVWEPRRREPKLTVAVKAAYELPARGVATLAPSQDFLTGDRYVDDDIEKGLRWASDLEPLKPTGECFVVGSFHARDMRAVPRSRARMRVGALEKSVVVTGDRVWEGRAPSAPVPFVDMPLSWERSFGGPGHAPNPTGRGLAPDPETGAIQLPNIEDPLSTLEGGAERPTAYGLGPMPRSFEARMRHAGTYGARWLEEHYPAFAEDLDYRLFMASTEDQHASGYFVGDEEIELEQLHPRHAEVYTRLPGHRAQAFLCRDGVLEDVGLRLDTVCIDADTGCASLVWRGVVAVDDATLESIDHLFVVHQGPRQSHSRAEYTRWYETARDRAQTEDAEAEAQTPPAPSDTSDGPGDAPADPNAKWAHLDQAMTLRGDDGLRAVLDAEFARRAAERRDKAFRPVFEDALGLASEDDDEEALDEEMGRALEAMRDEPPDPRREEVRQALREGVSCAGRDLTGVDLSGLDLGGGDFTGAILIRANLSGAHAREARFDGAVLSSAELSGATFVESSFEGAEMSPVRAEGGRFDDCSFEGASATESTFRDSRFTRCRFVGSEMSESEFGAADFNECTLDEADLSRAHLKATRFRRCSLIDAWMEGVDAEGATFDGCDCALLRASEEAVLTKASFKETKLDGARFGTSDLRGAKLGKSSLERADFTGSQLAEASLFGCRLKHARFDGADLRAASLVQSDLYQACFSGADLRGADLRGANLYQAELLDARLEAALLDDANLDGTRLA